MKKDDGKKIEDEHAIALLEIRENLRNHWSGYISNLLGFCIIANAAIWSIFIYSFTQHCSDISNWVASGLLSAGLSSIVLGVWRWYSKSIDQQVANMYPEILHYERILGVPANRGILNYLEQNYRIRDIIKSVAKEDIEEAIKKLIAMKRIGGHGYKIIDIAVIVLDSILLIVGLLACVLDCRGLIDLNLNVALSIVSLVMILIGLIITCIAYRKYQRQPTKADLKQVIDEFSSH